MTINTALAKGLILASAPFLGLAMAAAPDAASAAGQNTTGTPTHDAPPDARTLTAKQQSIPLIAAAMATSDMPQLRNALARGLDAGLTIKEAREVLVHLYAYVGFPRSLNALGELIKVVGERKQRGMVDVAGSEPSRPVPTGEALLAAGKANQTEISGAPVSGPVFEFAPVINEYLQGHLFGAIFERDVIDWQSRELATVGALAATPGVEAQLRSHMAASMRVGLSPAQLQQVVELIAKHDNDAGERARSALAQARTAFSAAK